MGALGGYHTSGDRRHHIRPADRQTPGHCRDCGDRSGLGTYGSGDYFSGDRLGILLGSVLSALAAFAVLHLALPKSPADETSA